MPNFLEYSDEELVRAGRLALRSMKFEKAYEVFGVYAERASVEGRAIPAGILANYALSVGHCRSLKEGLLLCQAALKADKHAPEVYFCLAQLYLLSHARKQAWEAVRHGLSYGPTHAELRRLETEMGVRGRPVVAALENAGAPDSPRDGVGTRWVNTSLPSTRARRGRGASFSRRKVGP
jgi:hypothetical protein